MGSVLNLVLVLLFIIGVCGFIAWTSDGVIVSWWARASAVPKKCSKCGLFEIRELPSTDGTDDSLMVVVTYECKGCGHIQIRAAEKSDPG